MARPVEQPTALPKPAERGARKSASRSEGSTDFLTALRGADQKQTKPPAEEEPRTEAAKNPAPSKASGKAGRPKKQEDAPTAADAEGVADAAQEPVAVPEAPQAEETSDSEIVAETPETAKQPDAAPAGTANQTVPAVAIATAVAAVPPADIQEMNDAEPMAGDESTNSDSPIPAPTIEKTAQPTAGPKPAPTKPTAAFGASLDAETADAEPADESADKAVPQRLSAIPMDADEASEDLTEIPELPQAVAKATVAEASSSIPQTAGLGANSKPASSTPVAPAPTPEVQFAEANHAKIVTAVRGQLLPDGGEMRIRLDPPELGALWVRVQVQGGVLTASFETSSDQATRVLSHSLAQLKHSLEAGGVAVDKLQVTQAPRGQGGQDAQLQDPSDQQQQGGQDFNGRASERDQQRQELIQKMWEKIALGRAPLDMKA